MKNIRNKTLLALLSGTLLLAACDKNDTGQLDGPVPVPTFTSTTKAVGLTTEVTFTATSNDEAFLYSWDFGDGTTASGQTVTHAYTTGGTFEAKLYTANRGGTAVSAGQSVVIPSTLNLVKALLTAGSSKTWKLDNSVAAPIIVGPNDADPGGYYAGGPAGSLPACQADDEFTFSADTYTYDAKAQTLVSGAAGCSAPRSGTSGLTLGSATGTGVAQITLAKAGAFIGVTDAPDLVYRILSIDSQHLVLRAGRPTAGTVFTLKLVAK